MSRFTAPAGTEISTVGPNGEEIRFHFKKGPTGGTIDNMDEVLEDVLNRLADTPDSPVKRAKKAKEED